MKKPLVSLCILTYQHENYIEDCLKGILSQTYDNMELLILDDASTDMTLKIIDRNLAKLEEKFVRVEIIRHEKNSGNIPHNANKLIKIAKGDYIKGFAGDDSLFPNYIEEMVQYMEDNPDIAVAYCNAYFVPDTWHMGRPFTKITTHKRNFNLPSFEDAFSTLMVSNYISAPATMIRRWIFDKYGYYDESITISEDLQMWLRIARFEQFGYLDKVLVYYRKAQTGVSNINTRKKFAAAFNTRVRNVNDNLRFVPPEKRELIIMTLLEDYRNVAKRNKYYDFMLIISFKKFKLRVKNFLTEKSRNIGASALVTKDVPDNKVVMEVPARIVGDADNG